MKLDSAQMRYALLEANWDKVVETMCRHFSMRTIWRPKIIFDDNDDRAIVALSDSYTTYRWSSDRGFSRDAYSWISGCQIRIGQKWWDKNA